MTRKFMKNLSQIFCAILLFTGIAQGAAFQFGGLRLDKLKVTSSSSTVVLTKTHPQVNIAQGSANQVYKLPDAQSLQAGYWYEFINEGTGTLTVSNSSSTPVYTIAAASATAPKSARLYLTSTATTGGPWSISPGAGSGGSGGTSWATYTLTVGSVSGAAPTKGTITSDVAKWKCADSQDMLIEWDYKQTTGGANGDDAYIFPIPAGYSVDSTLKPQITASQACRFQVGRGKASDNANMYQGATKDIFVCMYDSTRMIFFVPTTSGGALQSVLQNIANSIYNLGAADISYSIQARVPISGGCQ